MAHRYSYRRQRAHYRSASVLPRLGVVLAAVAVCALVLSATGLGSYLAQRFFVPFYQRMAAGAAAPSPAPSAEPSRAPAAGAQATASKAPAPSGTALVDVPAQPIYAVQLGVFSSESAAQSEAQIVAERGGAGYVLEDGGRYRVLAAAYITIEDARSVRDNLLKSQGMDAAVYTGGTGVMSLRVTAAADRIAQLQAAFDARLAAMEALMALSQSIDAKAADLPQATQRVQDMRSALAPHLTNLGQMQKASGQTDIAAALLQETALLDSFLASLTQNQGTDMVAMSQKVKYNTLSLLDSYTRAFDAFLT